MSWNFDDLVVGGQLRVGTGICPPIKEGDYKINGSASFEGPVVVGDGLKIKLGASLQDPDEPTAVGVQGSDNPGAAPANFMVTRCYNDDRDCFTPAIKRALQTEGNVRINGDKGTKATLRINSEAGQAVNINNGTVWIDDKGEAYFKTGSGGKTLSARFQESDGKPKPFDIPHPSKGEGWRLRYACIEGAEVGVYHRGRLRRGKEIFLPNYWKNLVHINSITVQLQPIGAHQDIIIKRWDDEKIYLQAMGGMPIDCFYHVYAERKDINPLITEYEGKDCFDYPDPNYKPGVANPRYDDPDFAGPPNTITM